MHRSRHRSPLALVALFGCSPALNANPLPKPIEVEATGLIMRLRVPDGATYEVVTSIDEIRWHGDRERLRTVVLTTYVRQSTGALHTRSKLLSVMVASGDEELVPDEETRKVMAPAIEHVLPSPASGLDARGFINGQFVAPMLEQGMVPMPEGAMDAGDTYVVSFDGVHVPGLGGFAPADVRCKVMDVSESDVTIRCSVELQSAGGELRLDKSVTVTARLSREDGLAGERVVDATSRMDATNGVEKRHATITIKRLE